MKTLIFSLAALLVSTAFAQTTVYYCNKDGKRVITDTPCENSGSIQERKMQGSEPVNSVPDPAMREFVKSIICPVYHAEKQAIMDNQYYHGVPADPKRLNMLNADLIKHGCPPKDSTRR